MGYRISRCAAGLLSMILVATVPLRGQDQGLRQIQWLDAVVFDIGHYPAGAGTLPRYSERLPWSGGTTGLEPRVTLTNLVFEPVPKAAGQTLPEEIREIAGEITVTSTLQIERKQLFVRYSFVPFRKNPSTGLLERLVSFRPVVTTVAAATPSPIKSIGSRQYATRSVLADGRWFKISITRTGIHRLTYSDLRAIGIQNPENLRVYGNGGGQLAFDSSVERPDDLLENPVYMEKGSDGVFNQGDYILFFATGPVSWKFEESANRFTHRIHQYSDAAFYFLTEDLGPGRRVELAPATGISPQVDVTSYDAYDYREIDSLNLIKSGRQWCWSHFEIMLRHGYAFDFPNRVATEPVKITAALLARSARTSPNSKFFLNLGETRFATVELPGVNTNNYEALFASSAIANSEFTPTGDQFTVNIQFVPSNPAAKGWLDYLTLNTRSNLVYSGSQLLFRDSRSAGAGKTARFRIGNTQQGFLVWDVTEPNAIRQQRSSFQGSTTDFTASTAQIREYVLFDPASEALPVPLFSGEGLGLVANQNLHGMATPEMIILARPGLMEYARELSQIHLEAEGLTSVVITPEEIYNEFSSGARDVTAIRDFLKMFYDRNDGTALKLKYFLFFGDGSYDNKNTSSDFSNLLPTYQSHESLYPTSSYVTDDFFGLLDTGEGIQSGMLDIGIGRLPVSNGSEASIVMEKIRRYYAQAAMGDWRNLICLIGDDEDNNTHMRDADALARLITSKHPSFNLDKIYLDAFQQYILPAGARYPDVNRAINDRMRKGALIMNYLGHGSERGLAHEEILTISDIKNWDNNTRLPLFMTATCEFSRFDDVALISAGEWVLLNPRGGGIGLFSTTRLVYSSPNYYLNREFYNYVFERDAQGRKYSLGDVMRLTKNAIGEELNKLSFTLLGDPALKLSYPEFQVEMTEINGKQLAVFSDTLKALSVATVRGYVADLQGNRLDDFHGQVLPTIYDKEMKMTNLANDGGPVMEFQVQNSILFKGKASVTNGEFTFSFIVPKDIAYQVGKGKFSFYASDSERDASGVNQTVLFGESSGAAISDNRGPELEVFMNDTTFVSGGITNESPTLLIRVKDESGINTTGNGIGHDITAVLNGNQQNALVLNDYYESDLDDYRSGSIRYPLSQLEPGDHTIKVKVWDVVNNSSEAELSFRVVGSQNVVIDHLLNYPNPFTTHTDFYFEHNQGHQELEVLLQIYTISGKLVRSFEFIQANQTQVGAGSYRVGPISWDGLDDFGDPIGRGTYFYRVRLRTSDGKSKEAFQKLVILK
ncbi:MAG: type IX secretion system sortase PorU [Bacteroidales bacterium]